MSTYAEFKVKVLAMIDEFLLNYLPVPTEFLERLRLIPGIGEVVVKNSIREVMSRKESGHINRLKEYNKQILRLLSTRTILNERTSFGWFILTKTNLLSIVDQEMASVRNQGKLAVELMKLERSSVLVNRVSTRFTMRKNTGQPLLDEASEAEFTKKIDTVENLLAEMKLFIPPDM